jgi:hypothetical protein
VKQDLGSADGDLEATSIDNVRAKWQLEIERWRATGLRLSRAKTGFRAETFKLLAGIDGAY